MANLLSEINIKADLRPCMIGERKALFHKWCDNEDYMEIAGGKRKFVTAIIEYENGQVDQIRPHGLRFLDRKINDYCFEEQRGKTYD